MTKTTEEKVALVTGSAMGIGLACAEAFAKAGYITVLADTFQIDSHGTVKFIVGDFRHWALRCLYACVVKSCVQSSVGSYGPVDHLFYGLRV